MVRELGGDRGTNDQKYPARNVISDQISIIALFADLNINGISVLEARQPYKFGTSFHYFNFKFLDSPSISLKMNIEIRIIKFPTVAKAYYLV